MEKAIKVGIAGKRGLAFAGALKDMDDRTLYKAMGQAVKAAEWILLGDPALRAKDDEKDAPTGKVEEVAASATV